MSYNKASTLSCQTPYDILPHNPGEFCTLIAALHLGKAPRRQIAALLGYTVRAVSYHIRSLERKGLLSSSHSYRPRPEHVDTKYTCAYGPNTYRPGPNFSLLTRSWDQILGRYSDLCREQGRSGRGEKLRHWRLRAILDLVLSLAQRLKAEAGVLLVRVVGGLRRMGLNWAEMVEALSLAWREFRYTPKEVRNPPGLILSYIRERRECLRWQGEPGGYVAMM